MVGSVISLLLTCSMGWFVQIPTFRSRADILSLVNTGGGGVLLAIGLVHLLPDVVEAQEESDLEYPVCYFFILLGYMILLLLEKVLFSHEHYPTGPQVEHCHKGLDECTRLELGLRGKGVVNPNTVSQPDLAHEHDEERSGDLTTPLLLLASMSVHSFFEGLVFGMQVDSTVTLTLCIAILIHKPVEAITLGGIMLKEGVSLVHYIVIIVTLSLCTPVGVLIGISLHGFEIPAMVLGSFISLTVGSFLYISTTEIIADEFHRHTPTSVEKWKIFVSFVIGVTFVLLLEILMGTEHTHSQ